METKIFGFNDMAIHGDTFTKMLRQRHEIFVKGQQWNIPVNGSIEMDQYDCVNTYYVVVLGDNDECLASARILPTVNQIGKHSYMINDAVKRNIDGIPSNILFDEAPIDADIWEATRYTVSPSASRKDKMTAQKLLLKSMKDFAQEKGIKGFLAIMSPAHYRMFRKFGYEIEEKGAEVPIDGKPNSVGLMHIH